ncbi:MAG: uracil-DNA glycosylase [Saprospiraceae bacterium]|jgi:uracil-DNA glycosylase|nr:uracil-DNA glycosylase [Saprospiraceae bacterium]
MMNPESVQIAPSWRDALKDEFLSPYFDQLAERLKSDKLNGKTVFPPGHLIFNAYNSVSPSDVKVVIIGQDPYHNPGEAMGLSFSVPKGVTVPPSLRNIYKELANDTGFKIPVHGDLTSWTQQGVFLLNAVLTVEKNKPASHRDYGWQSFTDHTIQQLSTQYKNIVFMLWGNFAKNKKSLIDDAKHKVLEAAHPSPLAGNAFQGCKHFSKANQYLISVGKSPIDWQI